MFLSYGSSVELALNQIFSWMAVSNMDGIGIGGGVHLVQSTRLIVASSS